MGCDSGWAALSERELLLTKLRERRDDAKRELIFTERLIDQLERDRKKERK